MIRQLGGCVRVHEVKMPSKGSSQGISNMMCFQTYWARYTNFKAKKVPTHLLFLINECYGVNSIFQSTFSIDALRSAIIREFSFFTLLISSFKVLIVKYLSSRFSWNCSITSWDLRMCSKTCIKFSIQINKEVYA